MRYGSVCSGIEAASVAWEPLGWSPAWFSEIEPFPCAVLNHHWPHVTNHGDMTSLPERILNGEVEAPDVLVGGTPCQAFSVSGNRRSLSDERGNLTLKFVEIANAIDEIRKKQGKEPCIILWENVPGVLNTRDNALGCFFGGLVGADSALNPAGKKWTNSGAVRGEQRDLSWRLLDAQFFGVPQRRKRIFAIASARSISPWEILFERKSMRRNIETIGNARQGTASETKARIGISYYSKQRISEYKCKGIASTCTARDYKDATDLIVVHGTQDPCVSDKAFALGRNNGGENVLCVYGNTINKAVAIFKDSAGGKVSSISYSTNISPTLLAASHGANKAPALLQNKMIRRLMPIECERLQGFPDNHTKIPWGKNSIEDCPDGHRYKATGNSMAVPVMRWIGERIHKHLRGEP